MSSEQIFIMCIFLIFFIIRIWSKRKWIKGQIKLMLAVAEAQGGFYNGKRIRYRMEETRNK